MLKKILFCWVFLLGLSCSRLQAASLLEVKVPLTVNGRHNESQTFIMRPLDAQNPLPLSDTLVFQGSSTKYFKLYFSEPADYHYLIECPQSHDAYHVLIQITIDQNQRLHSSITSYHQSSGLKVNALRFQSSGVATQTNKAVVTGDQMSYITPMIILFISLVIILALIITRREKHEHL